jgi:hypothetical protein
MYREKERNEGEGKYLMKILGSKLTLQRRRLFMVRIFYAQIKEEKLPCRLK